MSTCVRSDDNVRNTLYAVMMNVYGFKASVSLLSFQVSQNASRNASTSSCVGCSDSGDGLEEGALANWWTLDRSAKIAS